MTVSWQLLYQLIRRDVSARYQGSALGIFWTMLHPLVTLLVFALVFGVILQPKWPGVTGPFQFTAILFSGLLVFNCFAEALTRAPTLITSNANFVKKVVFPLDLLVLVPIGAATVGLTIGFVVWLALALLLQIPVGPTALMVPLVLAPMLIMIAGLSWFLAALGVYLRDIAQVIGPVVQLLMYLAPIIYPKNVVPEKYHWLMNLNPLTVPVEQFRRVLNFAQPLDMQALGIYTACALVIAYLGHKFFQSARSGFADVV